MSLAATVILNRNLPQVTNNLYEHLIKFDSDHTDVYVLEAGSDKNNLSKYCTWYADEPEIIKNGLRYNRGMNYALLKLFNTADWKKYDGFFLITNDTVLNNYKTVLPLIETINLHHRIGIISPCSTKWGEKIFLKKEKIKFFWYISNNALFLKREFIEDIMQVHNPSYFNFVFDGTNFRGYLSDSELIAKAYANDWAAGITSEVYAEENESYLLEKSDLIKTENYSKNLNLYLKEGREWVKKKYGFNSHWSMHYYAKNFYDKFFDHNPNLIRYKI
jgi:hypothetical protein